VTFFSFAYTKTLVQLAVAKYYATVRGNQNLVTLASKADAWNGISTPARLSLLNMSRPVRECP